ncbi:hypothetical protein F4703DRAFT_1928798 [Phycomyces blakesleeanus]
MGSEPNRLLCDISQQPSPPVRHLAMGTNGLDDQHIQLSVIDLEMGILLSSLEPVAEDDPEEQTREGYRHIDHPRLAVCNMISHLGADQSHTSSLNLSSPCLARIRRCSQHSEEESALVYDRMEHKWQRLLANTIIDGLPLCVMPTILSFLISSATENQSSLRTLTFATSLGHSTIPLSDCFKDPSTAYSLSLSSSVPVDPMIPFPSKTSLTGFLHPSDIERINIDDTELSTSSSPVPTLVLAIDCPKERWAGQYIICSVHIYSHPDPDLCPVLTFQTYVHCVGSTPCCQLHPVCTSHTINYLVCYICNFNSLCSCAHALGSTAAVRFGIPLDDILTHGFWASFSVFNTFYYLSCKTISDFMLDSLDPSLSYVSPDTQSESLTQEV